MMTPVCPPYVSNKDKRNRKKYLILNWRFFLSSSRQKKCLFYGCKSHFIINRHKNYKLCRSSWWSLYDWVVVKDVAIPSNRVLPSLRYIRSYPIKFGQRSQSPLIGSYLRYTKLEYSLWLTLHVAIPSNRVLPSLPIGVTMFDYSEYLSRNPL
jgi:hypothetical protein